MEPIQSLSKTIVSALDGHLKNDPSPTKEASITNQISWFMADAFKLIKNINETSLNEHDRVQRLQAIEHQYGIPSKYLI